MSYSEKDLKTVQRAEKEAIMEHMSAIEWEESYSGIKILGGDSCDITKDPITITNMLFDPEFIKYLTVTVPEEYVDSRNIYDKVKVVLPTLTGLRYYRRTNRNREKLITHYLYVKVGDLLTCLFYLSTYNK